MQRQFSNFSLLVLTIVGLLFVSQNAMAGKVVKVKAKKVFILLSPDEVENTFKGDTLYLTQSGKKKAIVQISKMKGNKVIALLKKGKARKGYATQPRKAKKRKSRNNETEYASDVAKNESSSISSGRPDLMFGIMGGFGTATQDVNGAVSASMGGSLMGVKAIIDYAFWGDLGFRARVGMDMLSVSASVSGNEVKTEINYLAIDALLRYYFMDSSFKLFANGGFGIYSPMSENLTGNPTALDASSISTTSIFILGLGIGIPIGKMELFAGGDYLMFPSSETVKTSAISGKVGLLFNF